jgi:alanine dehydrogenase
MNDKTPTISGKLSAQLANDIADACLRSIQGGMSTAEALSVAVGVVADLMRMNLGDESLEDGAKIMRERVNYRTPTATSIIVDRSHHKGGSA